MIRTYLTLLLLVIWYPVWGQHHIPIPTQAQLSWQDAELAALVCLDLHSFDGKFYVQKDVRVTPVEDYNIFNPQHYDTDQWVRSLRDAGFKIAILTVSHETGFYLHQSDATPYCMKALKWKDGNGDVLKDFKASCEKYGILPGVYIGIRWNSYYGIYDFKVQGEGSFAVNRQKNYNDMVERIVEEIFSRYGDWAMVWFDGGAHGPEQGGPDVLSVFEKYQSNSLFYHNLQRADMRWGGSESGMVPYPCWGTFPYVSTGAGESAKKEISRNNFALLKTGDPEGQYYIPAMSDAPLRGNGGHDWFWEPNREHIINPLDKLLEMYYHSVGHNTTLILGVTPGPEGLMPEPDVKRLKEFGDEIDRRFSNPLASKSGKGKKIVLKLDGMININQLVLKEDIEYGERVQEFTVQGKTAGGWKDLCKGTCIGHKFIARLEGVEVLSLRLVINKNLGEPQIKEFSAYSIEDIDITIKLP
jgi:alpha-L-fucosidase